MTVNQNLIPINKNKRYTIFFVSLNQNLIPVNKCGTKSYHSFNQNLIPVNKRNAKQFFFTEPKCNSSKKYGKRFLNQNLIPVTERNIF